MTQFGGIQLNENDLRDMPRDLRESLLNWYFNRPPSSAAPPLPPAPVIALTSLSAVPMREGTERVSFPEFVRAGLLKPSDVISCRALKRQKRAGAGRAIEAGKVLPDGTVEYKGRRYDVPSKLAVDAINTNGGNTKALNGYDYLFVRSSEGDIPLHELRDRFPRS